jgi:hypothetical protein
MSRPNSTLSPESPRQRPLPPAARLSDAGVLPPGASYVGCFADARGARAVAHLLGSSRERLNSVDRCLVTARRANSNATGPPSNTSGPTSNVTYPRAIVFLALQSMKCYGAPALPAAFLAVQLPDAACNVTCPGAAAQSCGGAVGNTTAVVAVYRILQASV